MKIGIGTGCFHYTGIDFNERVKIIKSLNVEGIEIGYHESESVFEVDFSDESKDSIRSMEWRSIHAMKYPYDNNDDTKRILEKLESLCDELNIIKVTLHPDVVKNFAILQNYKIPFSFENMDIRKEKFQTVEEMLSLKEKYNYTFVIDWQHVWEHDNTMELGFAMQKALSDRISHYHISGGKKDIAHEAIHSAENRTEILNAIKRLDTEKIMITEGLFHKGLESARLEVDLLKSL